jgi:hypothetical protein
VNYQTYAYKVDAKGNYVFSSVVASYSRRDAARVRNAFCDEGAKDRAWKGAITTINGNVFKQQTISSPMAK